MYGVGRLYFKVTDGFRIVHISSNFPPDPRWDTRELNPDEKEQLDGVLSQTFTYLGKGCQSYVFLSEDGKYVLKFFKYQRFRPQCYLRWFSFIPSVDSYLQRKICQKSVKLDLLFESWRTAFDSLQKETGLIYVHLNPTSHINKELTLVDKIGCQHQVDLDTMEFLVQKKAAMLCPTLDAMIANGKDAEAKRLLTSLIRMLVSEYKRGFADLDHALMQNTGVLDGRPIHVDVGQFIKDETVRNSSYYYQELFNKTWKFRCWLEKRHPVLLAHVENELEKEMGKQFATLCYIPKKH